MVKKLVFATNNQHKLTEIEAHLGPDYKLLTLKEINCSEDIPENETTLEGNARAKAIYVKEKYGFDCFADDTGLEIVALNGAPGVYSARYAGEQKNSIDNMNLVLKNLNNEQNRKARFRTVIHLIKGGKHIQFEGIVDGEILDHAVGTAGFGYDPIFKPDEADCSFAEMGLAEKNKISHRARAVNKLVEYLKKNP
ncbi:MAG: non-canonical purine NTP pyrophosphatase [Marinilabiliales bacterium]|nr:MAG: non-canonical purine NTP pyrophosphatase [Marinilabiliales bacterium]